MDNNLSGEFFGASPAPWARPVLKWIALGDGKLAWGGKLKDELSDMRRAAELIRQWRLAGKLHTATEAEIAEELTGAWISHVRSNDHQILALARVTGARVLCTKELATRGKLDVDFRDRRILADPRGKIYKSADHSHLLKHCKSCRARLRRPRV
ncbi:MAG: hypothetical protein ACKVVT_10940 [Dehalococcoidia bacterium]